MQTSARFKRTRPNARAGYSLLEIVAVLGVIAALAGAAAVSLKRDTLINYEARTAARRLALDLAMARRAAIATGDNHFLDFAGGAAISGYTVTRRLGGGSQPVEAPRSFSSGLTVTASGAAPEFNFLGEALAPGVITLAGPDRTWQVTIAAATGAVTAEDGS